MAPRRRCPVCRSKQWHKEPSSGLIACSEGHVLQNYRNEAPEADDLGPHALRKRALKSGRKKKEKASKADPKLYHGARARYHYFQCLQLLLRKQIVALISLWNLPLEFETICRDVWAVHLSFLPSPPPAEPYFHLQETQGKTQPPRQDTVVPNAETPPDDENASEEQCKSEESSSSESSDEENEDPEIAALLRENSASGSSDDDSGTIDPALKLSGLSTRQARKKSLQNRYDSPASNIAVLVLACWIMRIPVMCADFRKIIELHELPYLDPVPLLPADLTLHLTRHTIQMLSPHHAPSTLFVHSLASRLAKMMYSSYGIITPELNAAPILWRTIRCLGGTPTLYNLTKRLAYILSLPLTLHYSLAPNLKQTDKRDPSSHKYDNVPPELAFLATCIVVLKMVYGLDGKIRLPDISTDPACALPRLDEYLALLKNLDGADSKNKQAMFSSETQMSVAYLSGSMTDEYLDFCEKALVRPKDEKTEGRNLLDDYFPVRKGNSTAQKNMTTLEDVPTYPELRSNRLKADDADAMLPGQPYTIFNARDVLGTLPDEYELVVSRAARWAGVADEYLSSVIERFERRVVRWWDGEKKRLIEVSKEEGEEEEEE